MNSVWHKCIDTIKTEKEERIPFGFLSLWNIWKWIHLEQILNRDTNMFMYTVINIVWEYASENLTQKYTTRIKKKSQVIEFNTDIFFRKKKKARRNKKRKKRFNTPSKRQRRHDTEKKKLIRRRHKANKLNCVN